MNRIEDRRIVRQVGPEESVSEAVVLAVLAANERDCELTARVDDLDALAEVVDPAALDSLFADRFAGRVAFAYSGFTVVVHGDRRVVVTPEG